jgi:hypothetical protein
MQPSSPLAKGACEGAGAGARCVSCEWGGHMSFEAYTAARAPAVVTDWSESAARPAGDEFAYAAPVPPRPRIRIAIALAIAAAIVMAAGCAKKSPTSPGQPAAPTRTWRMGFSAIPPVADQAVALATLDRWSTRADAALSHEDPPWDSLLAGVRADSLAIRIALPLAQYYRAKQFRYAYEMDITNGLNRAAEAPALVRLGRSLAEPEIRSLYLRWAAAVDSVIAPDWLGLASETNLVRAVAAPSLYASVVTAANAAADTLALLHARWARASSPALYTTVQVETAWGRLGGSSGWQGIATDLADFPFDAVLGLSSYPFLGGFAEPESMPTNYFSRIAHDAGKPVMIVEGGWSSESLPGLPNTREKQARYVRTMPRLLADAHAIGWWQLTFADLALSLFPPPPPGTSLLPFASLGLVDSGLTAKPALAPWDSVFALPRVP